MTIHSDSARINLRTSPEAKALIENAATLMDTKVSRFMPQNDYEAARRVVAEHATLLLSQRDFVAFVGACEHPPEANDALCELMARIECRIGEIGPAMKWSGNI